MGASGVVRRVVGVAVVGLVGVLGGMATGVSPVSAAAAAGPSAFHALAPTRVLDTRIGTGVPAGKPGPKSTTDLVIVGTAGVSAAASAVVLNVTATDATAAGFVQVFPTGGATPGSTSNLNVEQAGGTVANLVVVKVGAAGSVSFYTQSGAHLVADVLGFFEPTAAATAGRFVALPAPRRVVDTRDVNKVPVANPGDVRNCGDFATWADANRWFWTYHRWGDPAKLDGNGDGVPCESLPGAPSVEQIPANLFKLGPTGTLRVPATSTSGLPDAFVPAGASAVVLNLTATDATAGFLQVVPTGGTTAFGASSNVNVTTVGQTIPNLVVVPIGADGTVTVYSQSGANVVVDVIGYFTGAAAPLSSDGLFVPLDPARILDTRTGPGAPAAKPGASTALNLQVASAGGVPGLGATGAFMNVTITDANAAGFVQVYPTGQGTAGATSNLNVERAGQTRPNAVFTGLGTAGQVTLYTLTGGHLVADVAGWFQTGAPIALPPAPPSTPAALLTGLMIAPEDLSVPYNRNDWGYPADIDGDCQDTRAEVLVRDSTSPVGTTNGCTILSGTWRDPYTAGTYTAASQVEIDHLVPLADVHRAGGAAWTPAKKAAFANDLTGVELHAVGAAVNIAKSDHTPDQWLPPDTTAYCTYTTWWITVKAQWALTVTQPEHDTLAGIIAGC